MAAILASDGMEMAMFSLLTPILKDLWDLGTLEVGLVSGAVFLGCCIGSLIAIGIID